jgi:thiosulfate reductase cytochrome b subunit
MQIRLEPKHPRAIRWMHWINFPLLVIMIWSGLLIYWAHDEYAISVFGFQLVKFFPEWFYRALGFERQLAQGMAYHFLFGWLFALNGLAYVVYSIASGEWRFIVPTRESAAGAFQVVLHDLGIRKEPLPRAKFNHAQRFAYSGVILMGAGSVITGLAIYKPTQLAWLTTLCGGYLFARGLHFALTIGYVAFFVIHIAQVIRAGWNNFQAMVTGYEVVPVEEPPHG